MRPGKLAIEPTKPLVTKQDLSLAYLPRVAFAWTAIVDDPSQASNLTARGNIVDVVTNEPAVLGLANTGPLAIKPFME
ncbi:MAG: hypothetical protein OSB69_09595, partial [Alphaproteobacteria bacterium]|nr:hypothetical protein [Alphaproteobacteria bacterium]